MTDRGIAISQIILAFFFVVGYFTVLVLFLLGFVKVPIEYKEAFMTLLGFSTAALGQIVGYFFARQRTSSPTGANA
jgi:hypothetical protein